MPKRQRNSIHNTEELIPDAPPKESVAKTATKPLVEAFLLLAFTFNRINRQFMEH